MNTTDIEVQSENKLNLTPADVGDRLYALWDDALGGLVVLQLALQGIILFLVVSSGIITLDEIRDSSLWDIVILITSSIVLYLWFCLPNLAFGGSYGKLNQGIKVVDYKTGNRLSFKQSFVREMIAKPVSSLTVIGDLMALFRADRRALHDIISGSQVVINPTGKVEIKPKEVLIKSWKRNN